MPNTTNTRAYGGVGLHDDLSAALAAFDLPGYIRQNHPECKMQGRGDSYRCAATWRGGKGNNVSLWVSKDDGAWMYKDHADSPAGNAITFLEARGLTKEEAWSIVRGETVPSVVNPPTSRGKAPASKPIPFDPKEPPQTRVFADDAPKGYPDQTRWDVAWDVQGRAMARQVRYEPNPRRPKDKKPLPWTYHGSGTGQGWKQTLGGIPGGSLWFGLDDLLARPDAPVLIVEGPKAREAAAKLFPDHAVISAFNGKGTLKSADLSPLKGRLVTLWPDADADNGGQKAFADAAEAIEAAGASEVRYVTPPRGLPDGWDLADEAPNGVNPAELLANAAVVSKPKPGPTRFKTITEAELAVMTFPEPKWAIPGLLPEGLTILGGKPKIGKSWMALGIARAVAFGGYALGKHQVEPGEVLYIGCEDTNARLQKRLAIMRESLEQPSPRLQILTASQRPNNGGIKRMDDGGLEILGLWLDEHPEARLIVIDTLARFRGGKRGRNQSSYEADVEALSPLQELATSRGVAILVVTHLKKAEDSEDPQDLISGSLGQAGTADASWVLQRARHGADATLFMTGRDIEEKKLGLSFDPTRGAWNILGNAEEVAVTKERGELVTYLRENPGSTPKQIAAALDKKSNNISNALRRLFNSDIARPDSKGRWSIIERNSATSSDSGDSSDSREFESARPAPLLGMGAVTPVTHPKVTQDKSDSNSDSTQAVTPVTGNTPVTPVTPVTQHEQIESHTPLGHVPEPFDEEKPF
jgi:hypothetical protein